MESVILSLIKRNFSSLPVNARQAFQTVLNCKSQPVPHLYSHCDHCGSTHPVMKSCKSRLCPVCNGAASLKWLAGREQELLPVKYFMLTFTVPAELRPVFLTNKQICYDLLFKSVSQILLESIRTGHRELTGHAGFFAVLHTWDQRVNYHPHLHVIIPAGCLNKDKTGWNKSNPSFLLPVKKLSSDYKNKLLSSLLKAEKTKTLRIPSVISNFKKTLYSLQNIPWVVHAQAPGENNRPEYMLRYLSKYVNKTAINDKRILSTENGCVNIRYIDRKRHTAKTECISESVFVKRLALHILPKGFKKTRFYGFMANRYKKPLLALCRMLLGTSVSAQETIDSSITSDTAFLFWKYFRIDITVCPDCSKGHVSIRKIFPGGG